MRYGGKIVGLTTGGSIVAFVLLCALFGGFAAAGLFIVTALVIWAGGKTWVAALEVAILWLPILLIASEILPLIRWSFPFLASGWILSKTMKAGGAS